MTSIAGGALGRQLLRLTTAAASRQAAPLLQLTAAAVSAQQQRAFSQQQQQQQNRNRRNSNSNSNSRDLRFQRDGPRTRSTAGNAVTKAQRWMQYRAAAGDFLAIARGVAECYAPLYRSHPALAEHSCALAELVAQRTGAAADADDRLTGHGDDDDDDQSVYRESRTKMMEQLALETLFKNNETELAIAVYENRRRVVDAIARSGLARDKSEAGMGAHYRSFFSLAAGAYASLNQHEQVVQVYEDAVAAGLWPTVSMNVNYVRALSTLRRYEDTATAYAHISAADGVQNVYFYRCALYYAGMAGDVDVMRDVLTKMTELRFALRPVDYAHCVRALDRQYYSVTSAKDAKSKTRSPALPVASYLEYQAATRAAVEGEERETRANAAEGARGVLQIFDQLVAAESKKKNGTAGSSMGFVTEELGRTLYPRALAAALIAGSTDDGAKSAVERVQAIVAMRRERGNAPFCEDALQFAVTGLLLGDQPRAAWRLVQEELEHVSLRPRAYTTVASSVLGYLCAKRSESASAADPQYTAMILTVLEDIRRRDATSEAIANPQVRTVIDTLCADKTAIPDEQHLLQVVADNNAVFRVRDKVFWFVYFFTSCYEHERFAAAKSAFQARDAKQVPTIPCALALACMETYAARDDFEFVYRLSQAVNLDKCAPSDKRAVCYHAIRACSKVDWLGDEEIRAIVETGLSDVSVLEVPEDIRALAAPYVTTSASDAAPPSDSP